ncbi:MAG: glutamine--fructose-6-phosphate transaminase (isomerizing) [Acidobacteria bacterium]|nr:glutamine--fructose-6-phosphate transaminase (isomerizing) [Acidobacteriota bacterium]
MCGIICYLGAKTAQPVLMDGLRRLEYRGYDSSGLALFEPGGIKCFKAVGKIRELEKELTTNSLVGKGGIAHTRWATHGRPSFANAHPHRDCRGEVFLIHNGIIENFQALKNELCVRGHKFTSETDTEVLAHLIEEYYSEDLVRAVIRALRRVIGTFGLAVISAREPQKIVVARRGSPVILGIGNGEIFAASDASALVSHTKQVVYLHDDDVAVLTPSAYEITNLNDPSIQRQAQTLEWDVSAAEKQGFPHFMLKEIHEEPEAVENAMRGRLLEDEGISKFGGLEPVLDCILKMNRLILISCGTSYYAGLLGRYVIEACTDVAVEVDVASESRYRKMNFRPGTVVLAISQSGETADTIAAVREAKRKQALVLGLVNVVGSTLSRETDAGIYNHAGPEIGVASTKAFISQLTILYLLTLLISRHQDMSLSEGRSFLRELQSIPAKIRCILKGADKIERLAKKYSQYKNFLYLGRKFNLPVALEGALKMKEVSYIHAEAYPAGEMKHGPIALIDENFPSVFLAPQDSVYEKVISNIQEIKARRGPVIAVGNEDDRELPRYCDDVLEVPRTEEIFTPLLTVIPLQLFAYYVAREKGCDIDQPRNLAKSVTVE